MKAVPESFFDDLDGLVSRHARRGRDLFDLALVAQLRGHGIRTICTCNARDFEIAGIRAVQPAQALAVYV